ncbi:FUSC family protein [Streptomyces sp. B-S-A8]|uniref:FUSC family protein n=1 Tax=Streptomyces solicavernae TaxID=3043614 RepID=A0ABT6RYS8_9ACTN|nr:FUSC family protein [Streptomyces sp. B-S-A8]MDI3389598.1 FUSC family protein [Streptomyces sp. B-S-A8]
MSWLRALKETARSGLKVERRRLEPLITVRAGAGLAIVVGVSLWLFGPAVAASSAFGAFQAAIATFQRSWRPRPVLALASGVSLGISTFLGYLTGTHVVLFLALLALWTFLAGLSWSVGPTVGIIAASNVAMMLVTITLPTSLPAAAGHAAMIAAGGLVQALLIVFFPVRRWGAQRDALADALAAEADYARRLRQDPEAPFDPAPLMAARDAATVTPRQARRRPVELHGARGLAERIRPVLASLADPAVGVPAEGVERDRVRELLAAAGEVLDAAARAIRHGVPAGLPPAALAALRTPDTGAILTGPPHRAAGRLAALLDDVIETADPPSSIAGRRSLRSMLSTMAGHLPPTVSNHLPPTVSNHLPPTVSNHLPPTVSNHLPPAVTEPQTADPKSAETPDAPVGPAVTGTTPLPATPSSSDTQPITLSRPTVPELAPVAARKMRVELAQSTRESAIKRHAFRVTVVAVVGYLIGQALPLGHGYWAPMASVMVMRPDFSQTYGRAVARFGGTLVGVAVATGVVQLTDPGPVLSGALAVICAALTYLLMSTGYAVSQVTISAYVVFLLGMGGTEWTQTVPERVVLTLVGGVLAMLSYAVYPAWETPRLRTRLADWLVAGGSYAATVVHHYAEPVGRHSTGVRETLLAMRDARIAWQDAVERAEDEPVRHRGLSRAATEDAGHALAEMARVAMLMEAHLPERGTTPVPPAALLAAALRETTERAAKDVRERRVPDWESVREVLRDWDGEGLPDRVVRRGGRLLLESLDELSESLDTAAPREPAETGRERGQDQQEPRQDQQESRQGKPGPRQGKPEPGLDQQESVRDDSGPQSPEGTAAR